MLKLIKVELELNELELLQAKVEQKMFGFLVFLNNVAVWEFWLFRV